LQYFYKNKANGYTDGLWRKITADLQTGSRVTTKSSANKTQSNFFIIFYQKFIWFYLSTVRFVPQQKH